MNNQIISSYEPNTPLMNEKLPGIDQLSNLKDNAAFYFNKDMVPSYMIPPTNNNGYSGMVYQTHMSPPLTPAVSPSVVMDPLVQFKRKFSVDVGPFGYGTTQEDVYRRNSYPIMEDYQPLQDAHADYSLNHVSSTNMTQTTTKNTRSKGGSPLNTQVQHKHACKYPYCAWSFKRYEHLKRHMLVHTGKRPHVCHYPGCGKSFSRSDNFHAHYRTHFKKSNPSMAGTKRKQNKKQKTTPKSPDTPRMASVAAAASVASVAAATAAAAAAAAAVSQTTPPIFSQNDTNGSCYVKQEQSPTFDMNTYPDMYGRSSQFSPESSYMQQSYYRQLDQETSGNFHLNSLQDDTSTLLSHEHSDHSFYSTSYMGTPMMQAPNYHDMNRDVSVENQPEENRFGYYPALQETAVEKSPYVAHSKANQGSPQKSHACPVLQCQRRFKRLEHLKRHMRIHTLERPFGCSFPNCQKTFSRSDNLSQHMKTHQRVQYPRRKSSTEESTTSTELYEQHHLPPLNQQSNNNTMLSNMVDLSWHNTSTVGC